MTSAHNKVMKRGRILTVALALAAVAFLLPAGCGEQLPIEPSRQPGITTTTTAPAGPEVIPPEIAHVYRALEWTEQEKNSWDAVNDRNFQWRETAFFVGMQKVRKVKPLPIKHFRLLRCPSYSSLMSNPRRYRAKPIRLSVYVYTVARLEPPKDFEPSERWPLTDGPIWRMDCGNAMAKYPGDEPISVFCASDPSNRLGEPYKINEKGLAIYTNTQAEIAGIFCKVYQEMDRGDKRKGVEPHPRDYPVVLAWQVETALSWPKPPSVDSWAITIIFIVAALAVAYFILRRTMKRPVARRNVRRTYRPLRTTKMEEELTKQQTQQNQDNQKGGIDPLLKAASKQYRKDKGLDDG